MIENANVDQQDIRYPTADGIEIVARSWPAETARGMVILIHGIGDHGGRFAHVARRLKLENYHVFAPDMRGHGRSTGPRGFIPSFDAILDDIQLSIQQARECFEANDVPVYLYGQSLGGNYVINFLLRRPTWVSGAIASSPLLRLAFATPKWKLALGKTIGRFWPTFSMPTGLDLNELSRDAEVVESARNDPLRHRRVTARLGFSMLDAGQWAIENASKLPCPLLLMHGTGDQITSHKASQEFAALAGNCCHLKLWPGLKHEVHNEPEKEEVLDFVVDWLARQSDGDS